MRNPYTQHLSRGLRDEKLRRFIEHWDRLEELVITVYKGGHAGPEDEAEHEEISQWLRLAYRSVEEQLGPYGRQTKVGGEKPAVDVFADLLAAANAATFVGNWHAMRQLPAAREALNRFLLERSESST